MQTFNIKPKVAGEKILDPLSFTPLEDKGEVKPRSEYWLRRILDGDVIEIKTKGKKS
ncbi:DUF2635 domain-containing protein [Psychromonas hadalis]|uniref:DUF2635 domain-containing protein n=1 Tax=Psychromonas hadalis TaxID=211669 RepID=UPI0003B62FC0|nr:DUF2635 domain-containing protein [Psychromonas hadalis]